MEHANYVNLLNGTISESLVHIVDGKISHVDTIGTEREGLHYILPGFVDAHVHIESSMLTPAQFARMAVVHGTVGTVSDPHEIANVLGVAGVRFMIEDGKRVPFKFWFGAPSCVPATAFETAGDKIGPEKVRTLLHTDGLGYLAEMMNYPGVLHQDSDVMRKLDIARSLGKPVDGHAPGLRGDDARQYAAQGISTDHECFTYEEGKEKIGYGMHILIREGSAARNFDALIPLLADFPERIMFCSDDKHPDSLEFGHINLLVKRALQAGYPLMDVLRAACLNPVRHYGLPVGQLQPGDPADYIVVDDLQHFNVLKTVIDGRAVAEGGKTLIPSLRSPHVNKFECSKKLAKDFEVYTELPSVKVRVISALDGQLITNASYATLSAANGKIIPDIAGDILKICVVNRYHEAPVSLGFVHNFGLKEGAIASSVSHDSHNIVAVGCDDESLAEVVNLIVEARGGIAAYSNGIGHLLSLPIAGLMSDVDGYSISSSYIELDNFVKSELNASLKSPFMTLSFMALLVIPYLKISDMGLFDGENFDFISLDVE